MPELLAVATNPFYSRYDVSNASANLQIIETSLIQYQTDIIDREIPNRSNVEASLNQLFNIVEKLDQLFTYRIMHSEILIYEDILNIDENTVIDDLATELSNGFGTYFGLIFVFLKSRPTIDVPRGTTTPPLILLNLWRILSACVKSNTELEVRANSVVALVSAPACDTAFAVTPDALIA